MAPSTVIAGLMLLIALSRASAVQATGEAADGRRTVVALGGDKLTATSTATCAAHARAFVKAVRGVIIGDASADANAGGAKSTQGGARGAPSTTNSGVPAKTQTVTWTDGASATARSFCTATAYASTDLSGCHIKCPSSVQLAAQQPWGGESDSFDDDDDDDYVPGLHGDRRRRRSRRLLKGRSSRRFRVVPKPCYARRKGCRHWQQPYAGSNYLWYNPYAVPPGAAATQQAGAPGGGSISSQQLVPAPPPAPLYYGRSQVGYFAPQEQSASCLQREMLVCGTPEGVVMARAGANVTAIAYAFEPLSAAAADGGAAGDGSASDSSTDVQQASRASPGSASGSASATATALAEAENLSLAGCLVSCPAIPKKTVVLASKAGCVLARMQLCFS